MEREQEETFSESIKELFWTRSRTCDYYVSGDYGRHVEESLALDHEIRERLGDQWQELYDQFSGIDAIHGEQLAGLQKSCYERGFADALILSGEIERAKSGLPTIFN